MYTMPKPIAMNPITLVLIDDHMLVREAWSFFLNSDPRFSVVGQSESAEEGIDLCKRLRPNIALLDINLPGINGMQAVPLIRKYAPCTKIVGVSLYTQVSYVKKMMQSGAIGYITKNSTQQEMKEALIEVSEGRKYICKEVRNIIAHKIITEENKGDVNALSVREIEIIKLVGQGFSSKEIASEKSISVKTVEVHRYNILKKLNLRNSAELVNYFNKVDLL